MEGQQKERRLTTTQRVAKGGDRCAGDGAAWFTILPRRLSQSRSSCDANPRDQQPIPDNIRGCPTLSSRHNEDTCFYGEANTPFRPCGRHTTREGSANPAGHRRPAVLSAVLLQSLRDTRWHFAPDRTRVSAPAKVGQWRRTFLLARPLPGVSLEGEAAQRTRRRPTDQTTRGDLVRRLSNCERTG